MTREELKEALTCHPEVISPNVILRPIYQELIFPNLAYIGGGGELAYWLERKSLFEAWELPFPMLIRRDSVQIFDQKSVRWLEKNQISIQTLFEREEQIIGQFAQAQASVDIDLSGARKDLQNIYDEISKIAGQIDPTLSKTVLSEASKTQKGLGYLESKMLKAEKQKNEVAINKLVKIKKRYFPGNDGLQERKDNFIPFYLKHGQAWIDELIQQLNPLDKGFKILIEES